MKAPTFRTLICLALAAGAFMLATPALARPARIAVLPFQGPAAERLRGAVVNKLSNDCEVVPLTEIRRAAASVKRPMGPSALWQVVSRRLNLSAVIKGQVSAGRRWQARLIVNQAGSGVSVGSVVISEPRPADLIREVARSAPRRLVSLVRRTQGGGGMTRGSTARRPVAALPDDRAADTSDASGTAGGAEPLAPRERMVGDDEEAVESVAASGPRAAASRPPMLEASVGPRAIFRALTFADNYSAVPGYRLPGAAGVAAEVAFYPAAQMNVDSWLQNLGVRGSMETSLGATTDGPDGNAMATGHRAYAVGLRSRLPLPIATVLLGADYGEQHFSLQIPGNVLSPEAHYGFVRPNAAGRLSLGRISFALSVGYLHILGASGINGPDGFPNASIRGGDAGVTLGYAIDREMQVQLGADYRRYAYDMNAQMGDALVVGGALDEYFGLTALFTYRFR
jgi:hypothetical protein